MATPFEADLDPETGSPRIRMNFENGWSVSIVLMMPDQNRTRFLIASVAACPTGKWRAGKTELLHNEASPERVCYLIDEIAGREPLS